MSDELEHVYAHAVTMDMCYNSDRKYKQLQKNKKVSETPCLWWARKQLAAFSTIKGIVISY